MASFSPAAEVDPAQTNTALSYYMTHWLRVQVAIEQRENRTHRSILLPFALGTWSAFMALLAVPHLRVETKFPMTLAWLRSMMEQEGQAPLGLP